MPIPQTSNCGRSSATLLTLVAALISLTATATSSFAATVLYNDKVVEVEKTLADVNDLWVQPQDLTRINGFELKPEGACLEDICIPIVQSGDNDIVIHRNQQKWFSVTGFAKKLGQMYVSDSDTNTWSFGQIPLRRESFLNKAMAPEFELKDRKGNTVKLSDFRGKKVFLVTWASWCGCRLDVPVWDRIYKQVQDKNVVFIVAAQDAGGEAAAGKYYDAVQPEPSYIAIIDEHHTISSLYNFVNVPSGAWIDEEGHIVRINEGTYSQRHGPIGTDDYTPALLDWIEKGADSKYVWDAETVAKKITPRTPEKEQAEPAFKLGSYFHSKNNNAKADHYWGMAQELNPDSWNYFREELSYTEEGSMGESFRNKRREWQQQGKSYYAPLGLEE